MKTGSRQQAGYLHHPLREQSGLCPQGSYVQRRITDAKHAFIAIAGDGGLERLHGA